MKFNFTLILSNLLLYKYDIQLFSGEINARRFASMGS